VSSPDSTATPPTGGFVLSVDEGDAFFWLGSLTINKVGGHSTKGGVDIVDHRVPAGYSPPRHLHRVQDETFYVLEGQFTFHCGTRRGRRGRALWASCPATSPTASLSPTTALGAPC
jgi:quercetin dioxygenase-like cupin family protein